MPSIIKPLFPNISEEQLLNLNYFATLALNKSELHQFITEGRISFEQLARIKSIELVETLINSNARQFIIDGHLTIEQLLNIQDNSILDVKRPAVVRQFIKAYVRELIIDGYMTIEQLFNLCPQGLIALSCYRVRQCITEGRITIPQLARINSDELLNAIIHDENALRRLLAGTLTIAAIIDTNQNQFNPRQSTHTASVHKSVSESALKLMQRYGSIIDVSLNTVIEELKAFIGSLSPRAIMHKDNDCVVPAQQATARITAANYTFVDPVSKISIRQLLGLVYTAIQDDAIRIGTVADAKSSLVKGLMEAQRDYNIDENGIDDARVAQSACPHGTFNKLINALQGIHPDCNVVFITKESMSARFPGLVLEELKKHSEMQEKLIYLDVLDTKIIDRCKKYGFETIWKTIKPAANAAMLKEFQSYYSAYKVAKKDIIDIVSVGEYLSFSPQKLENLRSCKEDSKSQPKVMKRTLSCKW